MAHPKRRTSKSKRDMRRSHHAIEGVALAVCSNCGTTHKAHNACAECGYYRGRQVIAVKA